MPLWHVDALETGGTQQRARLFDDLLDVLHRAGVMIGNAVWRHAGGGLAEPHGPKEFADVAGERGDLLGPPRHAGLARKQMAVILHSRAASRGIDNDGVEPA